MSVEACDQITPDAQRPRRGRPPGLSRASRQMILDAAEDLFGRKGIDGVSLREIGEAAGQRNNSVVRYHFQTKSNLLSALLADRMAEVERTRKDLVDAHSPLETQRPETLLRILWEPLLLVGKRQNQHRFIRLLLACQIEHRSTLHPIATAPEGHIASRRILDALCASFPQVPADQCMYRLSLLAMMFWAAVSAHDEAATAARLSWSSRFSLDEPIKLAAMALTAPSD
jgi:AcrR family transcriptional regulator